jgi:hypothetical protein
MKVRRIHPDQQQEETLNYILSLSHEERLMRHKAMLEKIYAGKINTTNLEGLKVYRKA